jgi:hypothetical protein
MRLLLADRDLARQMGQAARRIARAQFGISRFSRDWEAAFVEAMRLVGERYDSSRLETLSAAA